ncbi:helix-turn-helix domain-containing protein [Paenibacillus paridis]|uniref:helix-turn-helix domain-containing protein n=1 Tax=Paenibacillus paridis TaxID=2583376 RepID=UPI001123CC76|nr:helix-turn-helix domain-containing protein [Paenibacillus paridis]
MSSKRIVSPSPNRYYFALDEIGELTPSISSNHMPAQHFQHILLAVTNGTGTLWLDGISYKIRQGDCLLILPESQFNLLDLDGTQLSGYWMVLRAFQAHEREPAASLSELLPYNKLISVHQISALVEVFTKLLAVDRSETNLEQMKRQLMMLELFVLLLENAKESQSYPDVTEAVEETVLYMQEHYREPITVVQLLRMSGVGRWQYSSIFQAITGQKPLDYLADLRINRAKTLMLQSDDPLREIAKSVGFKDEYYFNRRFRQMTGLSPKKYVRMHNPHSSIQGFGGAELAFPLQSSKVVAIGYALGDLLALGVRPIGADLSLIGQQVVFRNELQNITDIGSHADERIIGTLQPELILHCSTHDKPLDTFSRIAPTIAIEKNASTYVRLRQIAVILGKQTEAESWIARYEKKAEAMWRLLKPSIHSGETMTIFVVVGGRAFVMGNHGISPTLYHPLAFRPTDGVNRLIQNQIPFEALELENIAEFNGDRFVLLVAEDEASRFATNQLLNSTIWGKLRPVQNGQVIKLGAKWNFDDPITRERLLEELPRLVQFSCLA